MVRVEPVATVHSVSGPADVSEVLSPPKNVAIESSNVEVAKAFDEGVSPVDAGTNDTLEHAEEIPVSSKQGPLELLEVIESVDRAYPLLQSAFLGRDAAFGEHLAAHGAYDVKLKGASENGPLGFYETYRNMVGVEQPTYMGGSVFGGYRIGRGDFQPWYLERQTNDGGEFKAGFAVPLLRNVQIDSRRAQLWRTAVGRDVVEPEIQLQRIEFVRAASYAYWDWMTAAMRRDIAKSLLEIAEQRNESIRRKVETGDSEPPVLQDNRRLIVSREAKLIESERKLRQSAIKLSLFLRDDRGRPIVVSADRLATIPTAERIDPAQLDADIANALNGRPEPTAFDLLRQQLEIDLAEARNDLLPDVQAVVYGSQDVGAPTSSKRDKSQFELEAAVLLDVPVQRRKARGKVAAVEAKLGQLSAKRQLVLDKIVTDVQTAYAAWQAAFEQIERTRESVALADQLAAIERRKFDLGDSDLLAVNLREQQAAEARTAEVDALFEYFTAVADYLAALGSN